jgi:N-terminal domain of molybdenum-binding protein
LNDEKKDAVIRVHIWMERDGETLLGLGRLQLLEGIEACGSIKGAAEMLGMSYRAAWGKLKASEEALGFALVEKIGGNKSGCRLSPEGRALAEAYTTWFRDVERVAVARAKQLFPFNCSPFSEKSELCHPPGNASYVSQNISESLKKC